jgi:hypothetical protein
MHHQKQRPDQQALINAAEQQRLQHGRDSGDGGANVRHIVQQKRQHPHISANCTPIASSPSQTISPVHRLISVFSAR